MKIIYISRAGFGGIGEAATYQYASIVSKKHDVLFLAPNDPKVTENIVYSDPNVKIKNVYSPATTQVVYNVFQHICNFSPNIIHIIQSPHCFYYPYYLRHLTTETKWLVDFRSPHVGPKDSSALKRYFYLQFYVDAVLTHSVASLKTNIKYLFKKPIELPPGVDLKSFDRKDGARKTGNIKKFVFVSSISKTRKIPFLIYAFSQLARQTEGIVTLDIYGDGNATEELLREIHNNKATDFITYHGRVAQKDLLKKLSSYDAGIAYVPYENFTFAPSLKSLEYSAASLPVFVSDTEGHKEYNKKHKFNFIMFENSTEGFVNVLLNAVRNGVPNHHIEENRNAVEAFDWSSIVEEKLLPLYEKLVA